MSLHPNVSTTEETVTEKQIDTVAQSLNHQQQEPRQPKGGNYWGRTIVRRTAVFLVITTFCGLTLSGCGDFVDTLADLFSSNGGSAVAQDGGTSGGGVTVPSGVGNRRIETILITAGTFVLETDGSPNITIVDDGITIYELISTGTVDFTSQSGTAGPLNLEAGDTVIERPANNTITVNRQR